MMALWAIRFFVFTLYESPKFLMGRGQDEKAVEVIHHLARHNGKTSDLTIESLRTQFDATANPTKVEQKPDHSVGTVLRRNLRKLDSNHVKSLFASRKLAWSTSLLIVLWGEALTVVLVNDN